MTTDKNAFIRNLEIQLDVWVSEMDRLAADAKHMRNDALAHARKQLAELEKHRADAEDRLAALRTAPSMAWSDLAKGAEAAIENMGQAIKAATQRFAA